MPQRTPVPSPASPGSPCWRIGWGCLWPSLPCRCPSAALLLGTDWAAAGELGHCGEASARCSRGGGAGAWGGRGPCTASLWEARGWKRAWGHVVGKLLLVQVCPGAEQKVLLGWRVLGGDPRLRRGGNWHAGSQRSVSFSHCASLSGISHEPGWVLCWARALHYGAPCFCGPVGGQSSWPGGQGGIFGPVIRVGEASSRNSFISANISCTC